MNVHNRIRGIDNYLTATKVVTIINAEIQPDDSGIEFFNVVVMKFRTDDGIEFTQKFQTAYEEDLNKILQSIWIRSSMI